MADLRRFRRRPKLKLLDDFLVERIVDEAREVLCTLGVEIHNPGVLDLLAGHGAAVDPARSHAVLTRDIIDRAVASAPSAFELFDVAGTRTHRFEGDAVYFTPGSAAITVLDTATGEVRPPATADYVRYAKLAAGLRHIAAQSTAMVPLDVPERTSDSYRLYLSLLYCAKPVVTGAFTIEAFEVMRDLQVAVRGSDEALAAMPLTIFSCCPTAPLKWSDVTSQNVVDCARCGIPVEFISMPLSGFVAPVTLVGSLVQHTAETLSGLVISQTVRPGAPVLWGGSPAIFDIRYETTPMGAVKTMMLDCANERALAARHAAGQADAQHVRGVRRHAGSILHTDRRCKRREPSTVVGSRLSVRGVAVNREGETRGAPPRARPRSLLVALPPPLSRVLRSPAAASPPAPCWRAGRRWSGDRRRPAPA